VNTLTLDNLQALMVECMGDEAVPQLSSADFATSTFSDLEFDSLARIELTEQLREATGVSLPDDIVDRSATPEALLQSVNKLVAQPDAAPVD
jgi:acyl carrier protein